MNKALLNAIKDEVIRIANSDSISLADEFGSPEKFKEWLISFTIINVKKTLECGIAEAYDIVLGDGSFGDLLDSCRAVALKNAEQNA